MNCFTKRMNEDEKKIKLKICFLGSSGVGKSCLVRRIHEDVYDPQTMITLGVAFVRKEVYIDQKDISLEIWDTAGQEKYDSLVPMYYRGAGIIIIVFDVNNEKTFARAQKWISEIKNTSFHASKQILVLFGNKSDISDQSKDQSKDQYAQYAKKNDLIYFECSAKNGKNVVHGVEHGIRTFLAKEEKIEKDDESVKKKVTLDLINGKNVWNRSDTGTRKCC